jgi:hypothetical protein
MKKNIVNTIIITLVIVFAFSGCVEHRYYRQNNSHSKKYYQRNPHRTPPPGIDIRY